MSKIKPEWRSEMTNTKAMVKEYRQSQWAEVMRERAESGEKIKAYCNRRGIRPNTYYYWQRKLREAAIERDEHDEQVARAAGMGGGSADRRGGKWSTYTDGRDREISHTCGHRHR
jgi:transposase-like protein